MTIWRKQEPSQTNKVKKYNQTTAFSFFVTGFTSGLARTFEHYCRFLKVWMHCPSCWTTKIIKSMHKYTQYNTYIMQDGFQNAQFHSTCKQITT